MPNLITNPTGRSAAGQRAHIVSEAVVSAYLREITPSRPAPARAAVRRGCPPGLRAAGRTTPAARGRPGSLAPRRRAALEVAAR